MIKKIKRIKGLGLVFDEYQADANTPDFKRFNVIFGWNGSGKSTLSSLFDIISAAKDDTVEYDCELSDDLRLKTKDQYPHPIRVFNQDYIDKNVNVISGQAAAITVLLGEASQELHQQIRADEHLLYGTGEPGAPFGLISERSGKQGEQTRISAQRSLIFTNIAKAIGAVLGGEAIRTYRKPDAERDRKGVSEADVLPDETVSELAEAVKRNSMPAVAVAVLPAVPTLLRYGNDLASQLRGIMEAAGVLLGRTVASERIPRLSEYPDIAAWAEQGVHLHAKHQSSSCEYCQQALPATRVQELSRHFSAADQQLKSEIDQLLAELQAVITVLNNLSAPTTWLFYKEVQDDATRTSEVFRREVAQVLDELRLLKELIERKTIHTTEPMPAPAPCDLSGVLTTLADLTAVVERHNATTAEFNKVREAAAAKLKRHYLGTVLQDVAAYDRQLDELDSAIQKMTVDIRKAEERMTANQAKVSSAHKGCEELNKHLALFLGHKELTFIPKTKAGSDDVVGYEVVREEAEPATRLSEGENTAIALVYFVVHLTDGFFDIANGIVVVDDPVSSLDSNSMYQAFSVIKNAVKNAGQVFILTHNFEFLKLLLNWLQAGAGNQSEYFLLRTVYVDNARRAHLGPIDPTLKKYQSEYQYLFKLLKMMKDEQDGTIAKAYPVPNIARKVWETFLMFQVPSSDSSMYRKMNILKEEHFDEEKLDAIYKFVNDQSHLTGGGFDPALVPGAQKVIADMFDMMSAIAPRHFRLVDEATA